jgi:outer membrane PBP1 activator LpoA protein
VEEVPAVPQEVSLTLPPSQYSAQFNQAEQALAHSDWMTASVSLEVLHTADLSPDDRVYLTYLQARIAFVRGQQDRALDLLAPLHTDSPPPALLYRILSFEYHIRDLHGDTVESAQLADQVLRTAPLDSRDAWKRNVWRNLQRAKLAQLSDAHQSAADPQWLGWLQLALLSQEPSLDKDKLALWRSGHPGHPAASPLPGGLDYSLQPAAPRDVGLLLPLNGPLAPAGKAVLEGYLVAYYAAQAEGGSGPGNLMVLDTSSYDSANSAYDEALLQGAGLIVGPLDKSGVADLATRLERPIPVLALNRIDQVLPASGSALVQLSLAPEDEAARIAELAFGQGARSALVITPEGDWGRKVERALRERWTQLGGRIAASTRYSEREQEEYSGDLKSALGLAGSEQRAGEIQNMLATNIESTPRRRKDIDAVFLLSHNGAQARSIKPLLAYHYAGSLPVYALSSVYSGLPDARNRDLNDIKLVETPWLLGANPGLRVAIAAGDTGSDNYTRLNALGADAFLLQEKCVATRDY